MGGALPLTDLFSKNNGGGCGDHGFGGGYHAEGTVARIFSKT
jgi:hypothetical protein